MKTKRIREKIAVVAMVAALTTACSGGSESTRGASEGSDSFPTGLAVVSPFDMVEDDSSATALSSSKSVSSGYVSRYAWATGRVDQILNGTTPENCTFDPSLFLTLGRDADCFGPTVVYEAHPDALSPVDPGYNGQLPTGDVGIWTETSPGNGDACAAAELNARMEGVRDKSLASLMGLASLICTANLNGIALPNNTTEDLTSEMNALGVADVSFTTATISHSDASGDDEWSYALDFEYTPGSEAHHVVVDMIHVPSGTAAEFQGRLSYRVNDEFTGGNCPAPEVTYNGSLLYQANGFGDMDLESRNAMFCGHDSDGITDGLVDPSKKYDSAGNPTGWGNNFSILTANFDPSTLAGDFAYSWQAGPWDRNSRVFNLHVEGDASGYPEGNAFYGYGADIDGTDGGIDGFVCDWTTPNATQTVQALAQSQEVSFDATTGTFVSDAAQITYAVTQRCEYDGTGSFTFDSDLDGVVDTDPATAVPNDLVGLTDSDANGLFDEIEGSGFSLPATPPNL